MITVHSDFSRFTTSSRLVVTIGTFDGVHLGHRAILRTLQSRAAEIGGETALLTFYPHPRMILHPEDHGLELLNTPQEKTELLETAGLNHLVVYPFSHGFSRLTAEDYVRNLLVNGLHAHTIVVGYDHRFGRNREGDFTTLREMSDVFGFLVEEIAAEDIDQVHVSSTKIREALHAGDVAKASRYLGYSYCLQGTVVHGDARGRTIGFPTANLRVDYPFKLIPANGVYAITAELHGKKMAGVLNIGVRPTVLHAGHRQIEAHLFDFDQMIYGENMRIHLLNRIRDERKFDSVQDLQLQIREDSLKARELCANHSR
jgi:riboflavin kinase/FMN adenylyltransferase